MRVDGEERLSDSLGGLDWESARRLAAEGTELRPGDILVSPAPAELAGIESGARVEIDVPSIGVLETGVGEISMEQRVSLVTLGVCRPRPRPGASTRRSAGRSNSKPEDGVVFFQAGGMIVALWGRAELAEDCVVEDRGAFGGIALAYNTRSPEEVDAVLAEAESAGATVTRQRCADVLGRLLGRLPRPRRPPLGGRSQPVLDAARRRVGDTSRLIVAQ